MGIFIISFMNNKNDKIATKKEVQRLLHPRRISNNTIEEEQFEEEFIELKIEIKSISDSNEIEDSIEIFMEEDFNEIIELELEKEQEDFVSLKDYDMPYNHTIPEEEFIKMSIEDQTEVIKEVMIEAKEIKSNVIKCYEETQNLIKIQSYSLAEEKVNSLLNRSIEYDGGDESISFCQIMSLSFQRDLLAIMNQIYEATGRYDEKIQIDERINEISNRTEMLQERQNRLYGTE